MSSPNYKRKDMIRYKTYFCDTIEDVMSLHSDEAYEKMLAGKGAIASGPMPSGKGYYYREEFPDEACPKCLTRPCLAREIEADLRKLYNKSNPTTSDKQLREKLISYVIFDLNGLLWYNTVDEIPSCIMETIDSFFKDKKPKKQFIGLRKGFLL